MKKIKNTTRKYAPKKSISPTLPTEIKNSGDERYNAIFNGLAEALLAPAAGPFGPESIGVELSQIDTLFKNNRWYMISNLRQLLSQIYVEHGIIQTVVDVPVDDAFRGGVEIKSKQLSPEQIEELQVSMDREDILNSVVGRAMKWNRLYGGAGIIILVEDQDPEEPLDIESIGPHTNVQFRAVDMWELFWDKQNTEGFNMELQEQDYEFYNYYAKKLHKSRVMKLKGLTAPSFIRPRLRGWGFSIVESLVRSINQHLKANDLIFEVLDEFKVDVYKLKNLASTLLSPNGFEQVQKRIRISNQQKNYQSAITMDSEDDFIQKELSFSGIAETMVQIRMQIAADLRMPLTKVFGISSAGFNSGEDDIENYNSMVEGSIRAKSKYDIIKIIEIMCQQKWSMIPDDLSISFKPLRMLSAEQEENVKTQKFNRLLAAAAAGRITQEQFADACNKDDLLGVQLDKDLLPDLPDADDASTDEEDKDSMDEADGDKGANKEDTQRAVAPVKTKSVTKAKDAKPAKNSLEYDVAEYEGDGGLDQYSPWHKRQFDDPKGKVDEGIWAQAKDASRRAFGEEVWQFVIWWYKKHGGKFA